ncbi:N-acetylmuramoyl-L-alanine amidase [Rhizobiaceae bacterium BDR2-2]|uniref:N-acetylmuramoyl-L-alanine amidase n=1 Tax=Ectorhizobium quercum TaxID=2965071 RepID=A0AAE3N1J9_9HYPH|nr:N-acetylmuramoyl-L-alanine amidase [Ectorhizobium quercum]MCX8998869.1 N-acetylmuramoyl-L-alanine amidase [Ectorhizobium quercum]
MRKKSAASAGETGKGVLRTLGRFAAACLVGLAAVFVRTPVPAAAQGSELIASAARMAGDRVKTRVVFDFDRDFAFSVHYVTRPDRIVIDLPATRFELEGGGPKGTGLFEDIRYGAMDADSARIVLAGVKPARLASSRVMKNEDGKGYRLVLEAEEVSPEAYRELVATQSWQTPDEETPADKAAFSALLDAVKPSREEFVIAVDAGHGGIDAGASGVTSGTPEKEITLAAAKTLVERLNAEPGIHAFLTRSGDEFLSLSERVNIARKGEANLFLSLHADTLRQKDIRGATVYTISDRASDRMAADLAKRENLSDELAGLSLPDGPSDVADILLDLTRRETQAFSIALARSVVTSFEGQVGLINNPHRFAGFRVLQAHDIPSVLLELGFLSNPEDEKLLLDDAWRKKVADLLAVAISGYRKKTVAGGG